ncbi:hypothetical protein AVEN_57675-1 [Araneus ventricosus]|uniref:Gustatory receptor n=1 Tax=Araneus ventricosus TaxID=182803 RepID=A0A4Y2VBE1_ARAVE|nr:hypothetical protein AVEN_57675-1 [Araneus ventricosus]
MINMRATQHTDELLFIRKAKVEQKSLRYYGMVSIILHMYGMDVTRKLRTLYRILSKLHDVWMHLMAVYLVSRYILLYFWSIVPIELIFGSIVSIAFPITLHYSIKSKRQLLSNVLMHYRKMFNVLAQKSAKNNNRVKVNITITAILLLSIISAALSALSMRSNKVTHLSYSLFVDLGDDTVRITFCLFMIQMIYAYQYAFPCFVAFMCGFLYYEFSELLDRFRETLASHDTVLNNDKIIPTVQLYTSLFKLAHKLHDAISQPTFFLLCTQVTVMFCAIAMFFQKSMEKTPTPVLCRSGLILLLAPASIIGLVLCASRISKQRQEIQMIFMLLKDRSIGQGHYGADIMSCLDSVTEKQLPIMTASGVVQLTPNVALGMFGSLFSYSLLILSLIQK